MKRLFTLLPALFPMLMSAFPANNVDLLYNHMAEVNKEWLHHEITPALEVPWHFENDVARIQTHLELVEQHLRSRPTKHLTPEQSQKRAKMLDVLQQYASDGIFPVNDKHRHRQPYFIDKYGTACAVGYLIIASGNGALAKKINRENNYAYIRELTTYPELLQWAQDFGFTVEELAWIQPGYQAELPVQALGSGTNGNVNFIINTNGMNPKLYFAGEFTEAGGSQCNMVSQWDGENWHCLNFNATGKVEGLASSMGDLVVFGSFNDGAHQLATWSGSSWSFKSVLPKKGGVTAYIKLYNGEYVGGWYEENNQKHYYIATGTDPAVIIEEFNGRINTLEYDGNLYVGGSFTSTKNGQQLNYIAKLPYGSQAFTAMGAGLDGEVRDLELYGNTIYAGGDIYDTNKNPAFGLAKFFAGTWQQIIQPEAASFDSSHTYIDEIDISSEGFFVGGQFFASSMMFSGKNMAFVGETGNYLSPYGDFNAPVNAIHLYNGKLFVGGAFTQVGATSDVNHVVTVSSPSGVELPSEMKVHVEVYPNPATTALHLKWEAEIAEPVVEVYNTSGKLVLHDEVNDSYSHTINCTSLPAGIYLYRMKSGAEDLVNGRFVVVK